MCTKDTPARTSSRAHTSGSDVVTFDSTSWTKAYFTKMKPTIKNLNTKASECEKLVEMRTKHHVIWVEEEILKPKKNGIRRVNHDDLYVTLESQQMELEEKDHLPKKHQPSSRLESAHSTSLFVGVWGLLIPYVKFMEFLPNKRKKKDDVFFLSFKPP
ncbi:hypothetical protein QL285_071848 [Trifolium repens]|nr:hypothetical protein QL285_071848 [Trifolium repens]